jgi:pSer/pThr/pTyr-binding forkhead associated (FHA) protein
LHRCIPRALSSRCAYAEARRRPPFQVEDTGTTNGTYVNNERIAALTRTPLPDGCVLSFGGPRQV